MSCALNFVQDTVKEKIGVQCFTTYFLRLNFQSPVSHLCANGMIEMLDLLEDIPGIDYNIPDNEGNSPLHFAAQAGHVEVVSFLLNKVRTIQVDPINQQGFTPLMKAALQGRIKCSKLLLFSGKQILFLSCKKLKNFLILIFCVKYLKIHVGWE